MPPARSHPALINSAIARRFRKGFNQARPHKGSADNCSPINAGSLCGHGYIFSVPGLFEAV